jgi:aminoglycoside N3'-acetyltransferase
MSNSTQNPEQETDMLEEYTFDYSKAKPNRFASKKSPITVTLAPDVAEVFKTSESVNRALRAILEAMPDRRKTG